MQFFTKSSVQYSTAVLNQLGIDWPAPPHFILFSDKAHAFVALLYILFFPLLLLPLSVVFIFVLFLLALLRNHDILPWSKIGRDGASYGRQDKQFDSTIIG